MPPPQNVISLLLAANLTPTGPTVASARLGTGTRDSTTFLRGDGTFAVPPGGSGGLLAANNLSDVANAAAARTNLGLGTAATQATGAFDAAGAAASVSTSLAAHAANTSNPHSVTKAQVGLGSVSNALQLTAASNLSDLASAATARANLGLGTAAAANTGTSAGQVPIRGTGGTLDVTHGAFVTNTVTYPAVSATGSITINSPVSDGDSVTLTTGFGVAVVVAFSGGTATGPTWSANYDGTVASQADALAAALVGTGFVASSDGASVVSLSVYSGYTNQGSWNHEIVTTGGSLSSSGSMSGGADERIVNTDFLVADATATYLVPYAIANLPVGLPIGAKAWCSDATYNGHTGAEVVYSGTEWRTADNATVS